MRGPASRRVAHLGLTLLGIHTVPVTISSSSQQGSEGAQKAVYEQAERKAARKQAASPVRPPASSQGRHHVRRKAQRRHGED